MSKCNRNPIAIKEQYYNHLTSIFFMAYFGQCIFNINRNCPFHSRQSSIVLAFKYQYCIRYRLEAYVTTYSLRRKFGRSSVVNDHRLFQANYGTLYASRSNDSKAFTVVLVFRALGNSISVQRITVL